jgi:lipopolysaccharide export system permease protein
MLNLLHRHLLKEIIGATALALGLFVFVLLVGNALRDVAELVAAGKLDLLVFLKLIGLLLPYVAAYALPLGVLTGTLIALGRLASQQEITAMKAAGVGVYRIAAPVFFLAFLGMVAAVVVNLHYAPQSRIAYKTLLASAVQENPVEFIEEKRFIDAFPGYVLYLGERGERGTLRDFWIWELDERKRVRLFLRAAHGDLAYDQDAEALVLTLRDGTAEQRGGDDPEALADSSLRTLFFDELVIDLPLGELFGATGRKARLKEMTFAQLMDERDRALAAEAGASLSEERLKVQLHLQKNSAMAFSVFSLAVFGVPLALRTGRKETYANLGIALAVAMSYYFLMIAVSWLEGNTALRPDLLIWLPNLLFQGLGLCMIQRAARH